MVLNLITPLFRSGMLQKIKSSIPDHPDINWIIVLSKERDILKKECESLGLVYLTIDEPDGTTNQSHKVNKALNFIKPGFFQGLDDDTTFNLNCYEVYKKHKDTHKLIIGQQKLKDGTIRPAQKPVRCYTDGAQMLVHSDLLKGIKMKHFKEDPQADCQFMLDCWDKCNPNEIAIVHEVISNYNFLR